MVVKRKAVSSSSRRSTFSHGIVLPGPSRKRVATSAKTTVASKKTLSKVLGVAKKGTEESPYAGFARPNAAEVTRLHTALAKHFGARRPSKKRSRRQILDTVVGTILSQNTTNTNSHRAFCQLKQAFPTWEAVRKAKPSAVVKSIKCGGLAPKKTTWIQHILSTLHKERGKVSMEYLRKESKERVHEELERFPGVGKKTSAIINLFDIGHPDMAVDTHVFRYACQLGWAPSEKELSAHNKKAKKCGEKHWPVVTRDTIYAHLDNRFPDKLKYSMHLILTDTEGGLPVVCGANRKLSFQGGKVMVDGKPL